MKTAQEATGRAQIGKRYATTTLSRAVEIKRLLKPIKGGSFDPFGCEFAECAGGTENA